MNKLITKARSGVTLVELLVVILIVTILSVSMLPLLQPFVTEAQYAAEPIPVIGNLRTKVGIYSYDKGHVPYTNEVQTLVETWQETQSGDTETFEPAMYTLAGATSKAKTDQGTHIQLQLGVNYEDLKGKRSRPPHYLYFPISTVSNISYAVGCFGDGKGLKAGTGYAVCELNFGAAGKKYIGTWKQYKAADGAGQILFDSTALNCKVGDNGLYTRCYVPENSDFLSGLTSSSSTGYKPQIVKSMEKFGWEFE